MSNKRTVEVFSAGCSACEETIALVNRVACPSCEVFILRTDIDNHRQPFTHPQQFSPFGCRAHFAIVAAMGVMVQKFFSRWRSGIFAVLLPALLLLPALHLHPATTHEHETHSSHSHAAVAHADFLLSFAPDHEEHHGDHDTADDTSSYPSAQIGFSTLPPRHLTLILPAFEQILGLLPTKLPVLPLPFAVRTRLLARDHAPPVQTAALSPSAPRSPPRLV